MNAGRTRRQVEHISAPQQGFGAIGVENGARIYFGGHAERYARGEVRLDEAGDHIHRRTLRGQYQMNADGARHLRQPRD